MSTPQKKMKMSSHINDSTSELQPTAEPSCKFFVQRKKRFCKMTVKRGNEYCGEHSIMLNLNDNKGENGTGNRIPCPLDSAHTVYKRNLNKHLKICNSRPKKHVEPYIVKDLNRGDGSCDVEDFKLNEVPDDVIQEVAGIVNQIYSAHFSPESQLIQEMFRSHKVLDEELKSDTYGLETFRHLKQTAALIGLADEFSFLQPNTFFIEFGAGKGQLAYYLAKAVENLPNTKVYLVDRASLRYKKDNSLEDRDAVQRIRADIVDFSIAHLEQQSNTTRKRIGVSKHLCGAATDLTLRCILNGGNRNCPTSGFIIALCCHHRCNWRDFCGRSFLEQYGINEYKFCLITKMASWFVCGTGMSRERRKEMEEKANNVVEALVDIEKANKLTREEKEQIGWRCKRVLDVARKMYMEEKGYTCSFKYYVSKEMTLENICFVGLLNKDEN